MATPIRWDNINRRPSSEAGSALNSAATLLQGAFGQAQDSLRQHDVIDAANWQNTKTNNTNAAMKALMGYTNATDYDAARKSGAIAQLMGQYGAQVDQQALLKAADERMGILQQRDQQAINYNNMMRDEKAAPFVDAMRSAIVSGNKAQADAARGELVNMGYRHMADQDVFADQRARQLITRNQDDQTFTLGQDKGRQEIAKSKADIAYNQGMLGVAQTNANTNREQLGISRDQMLFAKENQLNNQLGQAIERMGNAARLSPGSPEGQAKIADYIDKIKDPDIQSNARKAAAQLSGAKDMTVAGVLAGISGVDKRDWFTNGDLLYSNSNNVEDAVKRGKNFVNSTDALEYQKRQELNYGTAAQQYTDVQEQLKTLREQLYRKK